MTNCITSIVPFNYECTGDSACFLDSSKQGQAFKFINSNSSQLNYGDTIQVQLNDPSGYGWIQSDGYFGYGLQGITGFKQFTVCNQNQDPSNCGSGPVYYGDPITLVVGITSKNTVNSCLSSPGFAAGLDECPDAQLFKFIPLNKNQMKKPVSTSDSFYLYSNTQSGWLGTANFQFVDAPSSINDISCQSGSSPSCQNGKVNCSSSSSGAKIGVFIVIFLLIIGIIIL